MASVAQSSSFCLFCAKRSKVKEAESCFNFTTPINSQWAWKSSKFWELPRILAEKAMATHSSTLAWKIPWTEEPGRLQSMGSLESDITKQLHFHFSFSCIGEGNGNALQCSCLENPKDRETWWPAIYGVSQSRTWLSSSSKNPCNSSATYFFVKRITIFGNYVTPYTMSLCEIEPWIQCPIGKVYQLLYSFFFFFLQHNFWVI